MSLGKGLYLFLKLNSIFPANNFYEGCFCACEQYVQLKIKKSILIISKLKAISFLSWQIFDTYTINSDIFYTGLPPKKFPDFKRLADYVLSGELLEKIGNEEAIDIVTVPSEWNTSHSYFTLEISLYRSYLNKSLA